MTAFSRKKSCYVPKLPPPRPVSDPALELTREYVDTLKVRNAGAVEARLMRDWLRLYSRTRWIAVTERLPDPTILVLVFVPTAGVTDRLIWPGFYDGGWHFAAEHGPVLDAGTITHWMDLPEHPAGEAVTA